MLYDPKWEITETKVDAFKLETLIAWLEKQPAADTYDYFSNDACLLCKYFGAHGYENIRAGGEYVRQGGIHYDLPQSFQDVANNVPYTFGGALQRAKELQAAA